MVWAHSFDAAANICSGNIWSWTMPIKRHFWRSAPRTLRIKVESPDTPKRNGFIRREDIPSYLNFFATVALAILAYVAWRESHDATVQLIAQTSAAQSQLKLAQDAQRPWISYSVSGLATRPFFIPGMGIALKVTYHNTGNVPALYVHASARTVIDPAEHVFEVVSSRQEAACKDTPDFGTMGDAVFPGQEVTTNIAAWFTDESWQAWPNLKELPYRAIYVIGCIFYRSANDNNTHRTVFATTLIPKNWPDMRTKDLSSVGPDEFDVHGDWVPPHAKAWAD
jgi:hypothetical protein